MNLVKKIICLSSILFSVNSFSISFNDLAWITNDGDLQNVLKEQTIIKNFELPQLCRARDCYNYIICTVGYNYESEKTEYLVTKIDAPSIFFKAKLKFTIERSEKLPEICEAKNLQ